MLRSRSIGISARRAEWFTRWTQKIATAPTVHMASFEEGLGRIMFVAGALEHGRPFLGPLYKFISIHPSELGQKNPVVCIFHLAIFVLRNIEEATLSMRDEDYGGFIAHRGSMHKRVPIGLVSGAGSQLVFRTVIWIHGSLNGSPWK